MNRYSLGLVVTAITASKGLAVRLLEEHLLSDVI